MEPGPIEYTIILSGDHQREIAIHCLGRIVRLEQAPEGDAFRVAATLERYEFLRDEL
jgi:hypothetical protein